MFLKCYRIHEFFPSYDMYSISIKFPDLIYILCVLMYTGQVCSVTGCGTVKVIIWNELIEYYLILILTVTINFSYEIL